MIENIESRKQKVVVLFEVTPTAEGKERYLELASIKTIAFKREGLYPFRTIQQFECRKQVVVIECMGK